MRMRLGLRVRMGMRMRMRVRIRMRIRLLMGLRTLVRRLGRVRLLRLWSVRLVHRLLTLVVDHGGSSCPTTVTAHSQIDRRAASNGLSVETPGGAGPPPPAAFAAGRKTVPAQASTATSRHATLTA
ncbi:hypothetical protein B7P34_03450 [Streptosporangium nondiastaticum]|uniref:Uncharacterized protein n=1 Tax=Streptosporangium nondiastaticum TaxID=35764 RepID=A0A9X7JUP7_9ACTN|nr:hypothetical protein B7P34_03450 [Streptosporangium nondiastaticum]